jgi:hypothetical protein
MPAFEGVAIKRGLIVWPLRGRDKKNDPPECIPKHLHKGATSNMERGGERLRNANECQAISSF